MMITKIKAQIYLFIKSKYYCFNHENSNFDKDMPIKNTFLFHKINKTDCFKKIFVKLLLFLFKLIFNFILNKKL